MRTALSLAIALGLLAFSRDAKAERRDCEVVFVRAPNDVRLVIESWLEAEPRCSGTIELRVVETESGSLYLIAQRPDGRIHEREVPDAQSAGVLVASWAADDWTSPPDERDELDERGSAHRGPRTGATREASGAPGLVDTVPLPQKRRGTGRWFSVAGMIQTEGRGGLGARFEMDLTGGQSSKWTLGVAAVGVASQMDTDAGTGLGWLETTDLRALLVAARTWQLGTNWNLRWSIGLGPMYTDAVAATRAIGPHGPMIYTTADGVSLAYETSLSIARELFGHRWAITAGPSMTAISQTLDGQDGDIQRGKTELMFVLGARYRL